MTIIFLNLLVSLASAAAAVVALFRPAALSASSHIDAGDFFVRMYAARSVPFGILSGFLPFWERSAVIAAVLFTAAAIQLLDVLIAVRKSERGMIVGASMAAIVHFVCALALVKSS